MVRVYPLIEPRDVRERFAAVRGLMASGIRFLQLRGGTARATLAACRRLKPLARRHRVRLVVNDRPDVAALAAAGVHLGQEDLPVAAARRWLGPRTLIGFSSHTFSEVKAARGMDYLSVGPVFPTRSKPDARPVTGLALVQRAARFRDRHRPRVPLVAIGGVTPRNFRACLAAGADWVAAIGCFRESSTGALRRDAARIAKRFEDGRA